MKFLAILKDSVREAVDTKVFYVMVGLSLVLVVLAASASFTPEPGGLRVMQDYAVLPLNVDAAELDQAQALQQILRTRPVQFTAESAEPLDGEPDAPGSRFKVKLTARVQGGGLLAKAPDAAQTEAFIRERFGLIEGRHMMEAEEVHAVSDKGVALPFVNWKLGGGAAAFEVVTRPTPATARFWPHKLTLLFGALPLPGVGGTALFKQLEVIEGVLVGHVGSTIAVLVSVIITAFFIPNMLRKGSVDLLLAKPIGRPRLLVYKFVGGLVFIFLNTAVAVGGVWLALGLRSGVWAATFLLTVFVLTFFFAILYAVSTLFGVVTRSPIAAILLTCAAWFGLFIVSALHGVFEVFRGLERTALALQEKLGDDAAAVLGGADGPGADNGERRRGGGVRPEDLRFHENWFTRTVYVLHEVLPRTSDLYRLTDSRLRHDLAFGEAFPPPAPERPPPELPGGIPLPQLITPPPGLGETLGVSGAFIAVMLGLACWWFATKDY
jgi:ABC-type transport system involved in multi-copper enzyme maturation permease subunit